MRLAPGLWTRFQPMTQTLIKKLHDEKTIGDVKAVKTDFSMPFYDCRSSHWSAIPGDLTDHLKRSRHHTVLSRVRQPVGH